MNGKPGSPSSNDNDPARQSGEPDKKGQGSGQPADEEIGEYDDADAIQVDSGDTRLLQTWTWKAVLHGKTQGRLKAIQNMCKRGAYFSAALDRC